MDEILENRMQALPPLPAASNGNYMWAAVVIMLIVVLAIVSITLVRPKEDNTTLFVMVIGLGTTTTASVLSFIKAQETHLSVNSRLDAFRQETVDKYEALRKVGVLVARREGVVEGRDEVLASQAAGEAKK